MLQMEKKENSNTKKEERLRNPNNNQTYPMEQLTIGLLLVFSYCFGLTLARPCRSIFTDTPSICAIQSTVQRFELKDTIRLRMRSLRADLKSISDEAKSQPEFETWFMNNHTAHGYNFNQELDNKDLHALGQAGLMLQNCFFPAILNITLAAIEQQMSCGSELYAAQLHSVLGNVPKLIADFKYLTKSDSCISPGVTCTITDVECLKIEYPSIRKDGLPFTDYEDRLRKIVNTLTSLKHYIDDLDRSDYWSQKMTCS